MQTLYALVGLLGLAIAACCLPLLLFRRLRRGAGATLCWALIAFVVCMIQFARNAPPQDEKVAQDQPTAVIPVAAAAKAPSALENAEAPTNTKPRKVGSVRICLLDDDVKLKPAEAIALPATTVFEDNGLNTGQIEDPESWGYEVKEGFKRKAAVITQAPVTLTRKAPCASSPAKMYVAPGYEETGQSAADHHIFAITDVVDYPIPAQRPPVEVGKLIDDISVKAILTEDISDFVEEPKDKLSDADRADACLSGGKKLAAHVGGGVIRQTSSIVALGNVPAHESSFGCALPPMTGPTFFVSWDGSAKPSSATLAYIGKGGAFLTGATEGELTKETQACVALALKPGSMETADRSFRGVKIECQAFARDGGGGAVTVYRRFGAYPERPDPTPETAAAAEATSRRVASEASAKAEKSQADMKSFAEWWEDSSIPKDVKVFAMMSSRVIALEERCPTARKHAAKIAAWANSAGIGTDDLAPGGRYHILLAGTLGAMRKDTQKESVREACESLKKYD